MKNTLPTIVGMALALMAVTLFSCVKTEFDEPPINGTPVDVTPNATIKDVKQLHVTVGGYDTIKQNLIIEGVVVMDDRSGNFYKTIVIQDASGGIEVKFNDGYLYNSYPVGRTIYIKCQNLLLADYGGITQLIGSTKEEAGSLSAVGITEAQARSQIVKGLVTGTPAPRIITMGDMNNPDHISTLVQLDNVQFISADADKTYADPVTKSSLNRTLEECGGQSGLLVRTSGYADFAAIKTPSTSGSITGVLSAYNSDAQLYIRNVDDVKFNAARCVILCGSTGGDVTVDNLDESFASSTSNQDISLQGWSNVGVDGCRTWRGSAFQGNVYAQCTAYTSQDPSNTSWLISPAINVATAKTLTFKSSWAYYKHQGLTVWYSTNYDGTNFAAATWQPLNATIATAADADTNPNFSVWVNSGNVVLPAGGKVHVGFKYVGTGAANTTTWRIDDVKVL